MDLHIGAVTHAAHDYLIRKHALGTSPARGLTPSRSISALRLFLRPDYIYPSAPMAYIEPIAARSDLVLQDFVLLCRAIPSYLTHAIRLVGPLLYCSLGRLNRFWQFVFYITPEDFSSVSCISTYVCVPLDSPPQKQDTQTPEPHSEDYRLHFSRNSACNLSRQS